MARGDVYQKGSGGWGSPVGNIARSPAYLSQLYQLGAKRF